MTGLVHQVLVLTVSQVTNTDSARTFAITAIGTDAVLTIPGRRNAIETFAHFAKRVAMTSLNVRHEIDVIEQYRQDTRKGM